MPGVFRVDCRNGGLHGLQPPWHPTSSMRTAHEPSSIAIGDAIFVGGYLFRFLDRFNLTITLAVGLFGGALTWWLLASRVTGST